MALRVGTKTVPPHDIHIIRYCDKQIILTYSFVLAMLSTEHIHSFIGYWSIIGKWGEQEGVCEKRMRETFQEGERKRDAMTGI